MIIVIIVQLYSTEGRMFFISPLKFNIFIKLYEENLYILLEKCWKSFNEKLKNTNACSILNHTSNNENFNCSYSKYNSSHFTCKYYYYYTHVTFTKQVDPLPDTMYMYIIYSIRSFYFFYRPLNY